jgi:hypothetical protein
MVTVVKRTDQSEGAFQGLGDTIFQASERHRERGETAADEKALRNAIHNLGQNASPRQILDAITGTRTYSPQAKQNALKNYLGASEFEELKRKSMAQEEINREKNRVAALGKKSEQDTEALKESLIADGYPDYIADIYVQSPPSVQNRLTAEHNELKSRGIRQPIPKAGQPQQPGTQEEAPVPPSKTTEATPEASAPPGQEVKAPIESIEAEIPPTPKEEEWPEIPPPAETTYAEKEKWRAGNQKENNKLLQTTKDKTKSHTNAMIRYNRLTNLNNSHKLPEGAASLVINPDTGETYGVAQLAGLVNKETQDFVKTMNDFLIDAKNYFGSRVTNFDVSAFKSRLPTLLNSEEGRRLIIEQMKLMEELQIVHDKELENGLKHYGRNASYSDIQRVVDDKTGKREASIIDKINNLDKASDYMDLMANDPKFKGTTLMQSPKTGKFKAFNPTEAKEAKARGWTQW